MAEQKKTKRISDIVPRRSAATPKAPAVKKITPKEEPKKAPAEKPAPRMSRIQEETAFFSVPARETRRIDDGVPPPPAEVPTSKPAALPHRRKKRGLRIALVAIAVIVAAGAGAWFVLPKATVTLTMKKVPVDFDEAVVVATEPEALPATAAVVVPGELLETNANLSLPFTAANTETVAARASGTLIVYNAYSSAPQTLVNGTRFESPDKKIFRLQKQVTVPGAKVADGKITPSSVEVAVVAEATGEAYNLPASSGWRIPGFKDTPRYEGFYAETKEGMKGGFVGERAKPSVAELAAAREKLSGALQDSLASQFLVLLSDRFTALPGSREFTLVSTDVSQDPDDTHTYHLFGEGNMKQIVFEAPTLHDRLVQKVSRTLPGELAVKDFSFAYGTSTVDFAKGTMTFDAKGKGVFTEPFDANAFRAAMAGKAESELKAAVFAISGVEAATVTLSPFFVRSVPTNPDKIEVNVQ